MPAATRVFFRDAQLLEGSEKRPRPDFKAVAAEPVQRYHQVPKWLALRLKLYQRCHPDLPAEVPWDKLATLRRMAGGGSLTLDHWGYTPTPDGDVFIIEPYSRDRDEMLRLLQATVELRIGVTISACSSHYPTRTLRILMFEREPQP